MAHTKDRLTLDQLREEQIFKDLTLRQQKTVEAFTASGDRVQAIMTAYNPKSAQVARVMAYEIFACPKVVACLAAYFQDDPLETFKAEVRRAYRNKRLSVAQVTAMKLHADLNGWGSASLPNLHGHDDKPEPEVVIETDRADSKPNSRPPTALDPRIPPDALKVWLDKDGAVIGFRDSGGQDVRLSDVSR